MLAFPRSEDFSDIAPRNSESLPKSLANARSSTRGPRNIRQVLVAVREVHGTSGKPS